MRYDMNILWVEDTKTYFKEAKEILEALAEDIGISVKFHYIEDVMEFFEMIKQNESGFKLYDIFFIDYSLSSGVEGNQLISELRTKKLDSDILFYSSDKEDEIKDIVQNDIFSFEGVYIANKLNFDEKSYWLIKKNARRLTSLSNIRGYLMDQTSENDFTVQSYILEKFDSLTQEQKKEISDMFLDYIKSKKEKFVTQASDEIEKLEKDGISNINKIMGLSSELFPIHLKYEIFSKMLEYDSEISFEDVTVEKYLNDIVKARNTLAHKKLDVCKTQEYILYYDTLKQLEARKCPADCSEHTDKFKISIDQWNDIRKDIHRFGNQIDNVQKSIRQLKD